VKGPRGFRGDFRETAESRAAFAEHAGVLRMVPAAVAVPHDAADVALLASWAGRTGTPLVPRGAGTGMPGGAIGPGVAVDLRTHFAGISVDPASRRARVLPGTTVAALGAEAGRHGLRFPVDPASADRATIGGILANNSGGARTVRYGAVRAWTEALDVVLADGTTASAVRGSRPGGGPLAAILRGVDAALAPHAEEIRARWPRVRKNSSGYALRDYLDSGDAVDLLVGSEGTLALIVGATLRLQPVPPARALALLEFGSLEAAAGAVLRLLPLGPSACEMIDRTFIDLVRSAGVETGHRLRAGVEAMLFVEVEGDSAADVRERLEAVRSASAGLVEAAALAVAEDERERLWGVRHAASPLIAAMAGERVSMQLIEDGVVPVERVPEYVRFLRGVLERTGLPAVIFGHAGDGNLHVNPLVDVSRAGWREEAEAMVYEVAEEIARLGGTMSGEHGDGRLRAPLLEAVWGAPTVALFRAVKDAFDPQGILNPGVILPLPGQRPLDAIRY
jgi:FAD/FMN-containing dehydrogenase